MKKENTTEERLGCFRMGAKLDSVRSADPSPPDKEGQRARETAREAERARKTQRETERQREPQRSTERHRAT